MLNKKTSHAIIALFAFSALSIASIQSYANSTSAKTIQNKVDVRLRNTRPNNYVVQKGDSLWKIASKFLQNPWIWPQIWDANPQIENPHLIYPGDVISVIYINGQPLLHVERDVAQPKPVQIAKKTIPNTPVEPTHPQKEEAPTPKTPSSNIQGQITETIYLDPKSEQDDVVKEPETVKVLIDETPAELPVVKLSPKIRVENIKEVIKPIEASAIESFLIAPKIFSAKEYETLPYVIGDNQSRLISGIGNEIYIRGLNNINEYRYSVYHKGETFTDPENGTILGYEGILVGEARIRKFGDPTVAFITKSHREVLSGDRLVPADLGQTENNILPSVSEVEFDGRVIALFDALTQSARHQVVVTNLGQRDGIEIGNVLAVQQHGGSINDRFDVDEDGIAKNVVIPNINSGIIMIFKVFERVSYALIMESDSPIHINDSLSNPK